jgi:hypothetical protein
MPGKSTMKPLFYVRELVEMFRKKKKKLCIVFIVLEKADDRVPKEVLKWTLMKNEVSKI